MYTNSNQKEIVTKSENTTKYATEALTHLKVTPMFTILN